MSVLAQCKAEDWSEKAGIWGWHCMVATGEPGWQARMDRDGLWRMWAPGGKWFKDLCSITSITLSDAGIMH